MTETIEGNKLIAELFRERGYSIICTGIIIGVNGQTKISRRFYMEIQRIKIPEAERVLVSGFMGEEYPNEIDFNRLMPVVEKIESIHDDHHGYFGVHISSNSCSIQGTNLHMALNHSNYGAVYMSDPNAILKTKIESTWYNIVQFITWYNTQSK